MMHVSIVDVNTNYRYWDAVKVGKHWRIPNVGDVLAGIGAPDMGGYWTVRSRTWDMCGTHSTSRLGQVLILKVAQL